MIDFIKLHKDVNLISWDLWSLSESKRLKEKERYSSWIKTILAKFNLNLKPHKCIELSVKTFNLELLTNFEDGVNVLKIWQKIQF